MPEPSTDLQEIMRSHRLILDICNDQDLDNNAKLFAVLSATVIHQRRAAGRKHLKSRSMFRLIAEMSGHRHPNEWIRRVIQADIPRYEPPPDPNKGCLAPMIRREGHCGKRAVIRGWERDPFTGAATPYAFCSRHRNHADDWRIQQNTRQWCENGRPSPPPNAGGVLRRYFESDWNTLYEWAAPYITPLEGAKPPTLPKPNLSLIRGGGAS